MQSDIVHRMVDSCNFQEIGWIENLPGLLKDLADYAL
jgi:hypothetical protein